MPVISTASTDANETARKDRLRSSGELTAIEQAIQLDGLIKWVRAQATVDNSPKAVASHQRD